MHRFDSEQSANSDRVSEPSCGLLFIGHAADDVINPPRHSGGVGFDLAPLVGGVLGLELGDELRCRVCLPQRLQRMDNQHAFGMPHSGLAA